MSIWGILSTIMLNFQFGGICVVFSSILIKQIQVFPMMKFYIKNGMSFCVCVGTS